MNAGATNRDRALVAAEQATIGAVFIDNAVFDRVSRALKPEDFADDRHRVIWQTFGRLMARGVSPVDPLCVSDDLEGRGELDGAGGMSYVLSLVDATATAQGADQWADGVRRASIQRQAWRLGREIAQLAQATPTADADSLWDTIADRLQAARNRQVRERSCELVQGMREVIERHELIRTGRAMPYGVLTGFDDLDELGGGIWPANTFYVGGRPATGKTGWALNVAINVARGGKGVLYVSTEVTYRDVANRALGIIGKVDTRALRTGALDDVASGRLRNLGEEMRAVGKRIVVADKPPIGIEYIGAEMRDYGTVAGRPPLALVVVDHLHQLVAANAKATREQQIAHLTGQMGMLGLAKRHDVAMLVVSQLNRGVEHRADKTPTMADFRDGGSIEQDAHNAGILWLQGQESGQARPVCGPVTLTMLKVRDGDIGDVPLVYDRSTQTFMSGERRRGF